MNVLNKFLFDHLSKRFNKVGIVNQGQAMFASNRLEIDWQTGKGKRRLDIDGWGESYRVSCPFCTDTRQRLQISHRWAEPDVETHQDNLCLLKCYNEDCFARNREAQKRLHAMVFPDGDWADRVELPEHLLKPAVPTVSAPLLLPPCIPLDLMETDHPALQYLRGRGFDPLQLARDRGVAYCESCITSKPKIFEPRIIIPIHQPVPSIHPVYRIPCDKLALVGWQARVLRSDITSTTRKYLNATGMKRNQIVYGVPVAERSTGPVVVVEGVTSAWRVGGNAVALLGKTASREQARLIAHHFTRRPVVVWLDPGAEADAVRVRDQIRSAKSAIRSRDNVVIATTPAGRGDPGECTPEEVSATIKAALGT